MARVTLCVAQGRNAHHARRRYRPDPSISCQTIRSASSQIAPHWPSAMTIPTGSLNRNSRSLPGTRATVLPSKKPPLTVADTRLLSSSFSASWRLRTCDATAAPNSCRCRARCERLSRARGWLSHGRLPVPKQKALTCADFQRPTQLPLSWSCPSDLTVASPWPNSSHPPTHLRPGPRLRPRTGRTAEHGSASLPGARALGFPPYQPSRKPWRCT